MRGDDGPVARQPHRGLSVAFDRNSLKDFVLGFRKRKLERQSIAKSQEKIRERKQKNEARKERRDALKAEFNEKTKLRKKQREGQLMPSINAQF